MAAFLHSRTVRFGECDPAGVVYYPVFFRWFHEAMESWFSEGMGAPYSAVLQDVGFPAKSLNVEFDRPCKMDDPIRLALSVIEMGRSSLHLKIDVLGEDGLRAHAKLVCVCIGVSGSEFQFRPVPIPEHLREKMKAWHI